MKRALVGVLSLLLAQSALHGEATWDDQLREMQHWILHISAINAINGLNLSKEQAVKLKALARQLDAAGVAVPMAKGKLYGDLNEVRDAYQALRDVLLKGGEIPKEIQERAMAARKKEAAIIRSSLTVASDPNAPGDCGRCHAPPQKFGTSKAGDEAVDIPLNRPELFPNPDAARKSTDLAHLEGELGSWKGTVALARLAPEVSAVLTDAQKEIVDKFACCLIPPQELSDPVRAGQADASPKELELLRKVRSVPAAVWPKVKEPWVNHIAKLEDLKLPGRSEAEREAGRRRVAGVFEKVRAASDTEFEMNKEAFCVELKGKKEQNLSDRKRQFKFAYFLLNPGADEIYDAIIQRSRAQ